MRSFVSLFFLWSGNRTPCVCVCVCVCVCWLTRCFLLRRNCATAASIYRAMRPRSVGRVTEALDFTGQRFFFSPTDKISSSANTAITRVFHFVRAPAAERKSHSRRQTHVGAPLGWKRRKKNDEESPRHGWPASVLPSSDRFRHQA